MAPAMPAFSFGNCSYIKACEVGNKAPPANPCNILKIINEIKLGANPHATEVIVKILIQPK